MTQPAGRKENQHYVPKMLLRYFSIEEGAKRGREQVHVLDKWNSRKFIANIRNIAAAFEFYETQMAGVPVNAEAILSDLEGEAAATLQRVIETETIGCLNQEEREWLAVFCAVLLVRTQWVRNRVADLNGELEAHIRSLGYDPDQVDGFQRMSEEDVKAMTIRLRLTERSRSCASSLPIIQQQQVSKSPNGYETERYRNCEHYRTMLDTHHRTATRYPTTAKCQRVVLVW